MNNVSRLLLKRAEKAERVLATMVKANDMIEAICDEEIGKLKARIVELEARVAELEYEDEPHIEDEDGSIAFGEMLERKAQEGADRDEAMYGPDPF